MRQLLPLLPALLLAACGPPRVELEIDIRVPEEVLDAIPLETYPIAVEAGIDLIDLDMPVLWRVDVICSPESARAGAYRVSTEASDVTCRDGVAAGAAVYPVDIEDFECEELSRNGRESNRFVADKSQVLATAHEDEVFESGRAPCRDGTELVTLELELPDAAEQE